MLYRTIYRAKPGLGLKLYLFDFNTWGLLLTVRTIVAPEMGRQTDANKDIFISLHIARKPELEVTDGRSSTKIHLLILFYQDAAG